ncbi:MAG: TPR end-of-group domain-containing protein [Gammaproteobacteria bacterium]
MSILNLLTNRSKVNAAAKKTARARKREGDVAEQLFQQAFQEFQTVVGSDSVIADALYHWGFALFHYAQTKTGEEADRVYQQACEKFSFCMVMNPSHLGAAIDWGAALMEQARNRGENAQSELYTAAREKFLAANAIQAGSASYNLACIHAIQGDAEGCREALENAREHGSLPDLGAILNDADLARVQHQQWFTEFVEALQEQLESAAAGKPQSVETELKEAVSPDEGSKGAEEK